MQIKSGASMQQWSTFPSSLSFISFARDSICSMVDWVLASVLRVGDGPMPSSSSSSSLSDTGVTSTVATVGGKTGPIKEGSFDGISPAAENPSGNAGPNNCTDVFDTSFSDNWHLSLFGWSEWWLDDEEREESDEDEWRLLRSPLNLGRTSAWRVSEFTFVKPGGNEGP